MDSNYLLPNKINKALSNGISILTSECGKGNLENVKLLLENGADPNGITDEGCPLLTPLSIMHEVSDYKVFKKIITELLKHKADINYEPILNVPLIYNVITICKKDVDKKVIFLLKKGFNPNGSIFYNPLLYIVQHKLYSKKYKKIMEYLLLYGADIYQENYEKRAVIDYINEETEFLKNKELFSKKHKYLSYYNLLYMKIQYPRKTIEKDVAFLQKNYTSFDYDFIVNKRKQLRRKELSNDMTLMGNDVHQFTDTELLFYKNTWVFHRSEIPYLLFTQKNPYTNEPLEQDFIEKIVNDSVIIEITLEEMLTPKPEKRVLANIQEYYKNFLTHIFKSVNTYVDYGKLEMMNPIFLKELGEILSRFVNVNYSNFNNFLNMSVYLYQLIRYRYISTSLIVYSIDEILSDYNFREDVKNNFGELFTELKNEFSQISYNEFLVYLNLLEPAKRTHILTEFKKRLNGLPHHEFWWQIKSKFKYH